MMRGSDEDPSLEGGRKSPDALAGPAVHVQDKIKSVVSDPSKRMRAIVAVVVMSVCFLLLFGLGSPKHEPHRVPASRRVSHKDTDLIDMVATQLRLGLVDDPTLCGLGGPAVGSAIRVLVTRDRSEFVTWINPEIVELHTPPRNDLVALTMCPTIRGEEKPQRNVTHSREVTVESGLSQRVQKRLKGQEAFCVQAYAQLFEEGAVCR